MRQPVRREDGERHGAAAEGGRGTTVVARAPGALERRIRPADLGAVAEVRRALRELLRRWDGPAPAGLCDTAALLVSELVTNALVHTTGGALLTATVTDRLRVEVRDCASARPEPRPPTGDGTSGRGLILVRSLADAWGVRPHALGKSVWFELGGGPA
ncbi:ATP-binding protein [Streptomyces benahoarensis]|uniref:ATP-binding protein n=1 Tax=Streptomyces benahoarensis TaxID=2595054 RepID=A0A553ZCP3_9ACTN|nr:ATP-binding protein [Streptomyces benahoarensis]TSB21086.1 ATP-binding protein [Streptomyces benahoarensis]TSB39205.1 ATP-binding protein [Streptomyces benahoarensis]